MRKIVTNRLYTKEKAREILSSLLVRLIEDHDIWAWSPKGMALLPMIVDITSGPFKETGLAGCIPLPGDTAEQNVSTFILHSQLRTVFLIKNPNNDDKIDHFAYPEDIQMAEKCPVLLASALKRPKEEKLIEIKRSLPPAEHGTIGMIISREKQTAYNISELPLKSQELQKRISKMLEEQTEQNATILGSEGDPLRLVFKETGVIQVMIQQLAQDYYQHHLEVAQKRPSTIDPSLPSGDIYSSTCFPVLAVNAGIWSGASGKKRGWKEKKGQGPQFELSSKRGNSYTAMEYNTTARETSIDNTLAKELWEQLDQYRDHDVDAFAIALAYSAKVKGQSFWIFGDDIQDHRGKEPKKHNDTPNGEMRPAGHRKDSIIPYGESFGRLSNTWINIRQVVDEPEYDKKAKRRKQRVFTHSGRLLMVEQVWYQKEIDPDTGETINGHAIGWKIRVGEWLQTYLEFPNDQIALLSQKILKYDPHNNPWEKRLGYYFFIYGHISNPKGGATAFNRKVEDLLDNISLDIDTRFPQRTRDRFEKAMNRLRQDDIINDWHYEKELNLPSKRWQELSILR